MSQVISPGEARVRDALRARGGALAAAALAGLSEHGLPHRRDEGWRWSDLSRAVETDLPFAVGDATNAEEHARMAREHGDVPALLAASFGKTRTIRAEGDTPVLIIERLGGPQIDFSHLHVEAGQGARVERIVFVSESDGVVMNSARVSVGAQASFRQLVINEGARFARVDTLAKLTGEGAELTLNGVYLAGRHRHADLTSRVEHETARATTLQLTKGAARAHGHAVVQGRIVVREGAQATLARQYHHGLMLEEGAEILAKPELLIFADDVQCAHGNAIGSLDEDALFYMRTRGLPAAQAHALLTEAFLLEALPDWLDAAQRTESETMIRAWLARGAR